EYTQPVVRGPEDRILLAQRLCRQNVTVMPVPVASVLGDDLKFFVAFVPRKQHTVFQHEVWVGLFLERFPRRHNVVANFEVGRYFRTEWQRVERTKLEGDRR